MSQAIVDLINAMDDESLILFLTRRTQTYLLRLYRGPYGHKLSWNIKTYIRALDEKRFINMYGLDLYAYLRIFTTSKCIKYYTDEGVMNKKNMPYLATVIDELDMDTSILDNYVDQYAYYPDGFGLFHMEMDKCSTNRELWF